MKWFFELGNKYAKQSDWKDFAFLKFCLFSMGLLVGVNLPSKHRQKTSLFAGSVFVLTYIPLMLKVFRTAKLDTKDNQ